MEFRIRRSILGALLLCSANCTPQDAQLMCTQEELGELYKRRIEPLLAEDRPKSCNECHLSGIDLSLFSRGDACQTMACLSEQGLVDLERPEESKILEWVARATPSSELITEEVIQAEYDGFLEWIQWSSSCGETCASFDNPCGGSEAQPSCSTGNDVNPDFVDPGDCSARTREAVFREKVFAWRGRCSSCHFDDSYGPPTNMAPRWISSGPCNQASLETMRTVLSRDYINIDDPAQSLLLLKPLAEDLGGVEHGGGAKFHAFDDPAYVDILYWITRERDCADEAP